MNNNLTQNLIRKKLRRTCFSVRSKRLKSMLDNTGTTMVELIVTFALLAIFMAAAATFIGAEASLYYYVKGETYSNQVSDIILQKVESELDGAKYYPTTGYDSPNPVVTSDYSLISLYDKTDTAVTVSANETNGLVVHYPSISIEDPTTHVFNSLSETDWKFDEAVYYGFKVKSLKIVPVKQATAAITSPYGVTVNPDDYPANIVLVLLAIEKDGYNTFYSYRFVKMYNLPDNYPWTNSGGA